MQLFQLTGLVNKPANAHKDTALADAIRKALDAKQAKPAEKPASHA